MYIYTHFLSSVDLEIDRYVQQQSQGGLIILRVTEMFKASKFVVPGGEPGQGSARRACQGREVPGRSARGSARYGEWRNSHSPGVVREDMKGQGIAKKKRKNYSFQNLDFRQNLTIDAVYHLEVRA